MDSYFHSTVAREKKYELVSSNCGRGGGGGKKGNFASLGTEDLRRGASIRSIIAEGKKGREKSSAFPLLGGKASGKKGRGQSRMSIS